MYLKYGNYSHPIAEADVVITRSPVRNEGGMVVGAKHVWQIHGFLQAANQTALTAAILALEVAYDTDALDIGLFLDDNTPTAHILLSADCKGGTKTSPVTYKEGKGAEYSTYRSYEITVEGETFNDEVNLMAFHESLTFGGGGPLDVFLQPINGLPIKQRVASNTPFTVIQDGMAIGRFGYPDPMNPIWPAAEHRNRRRLIKATPKRFGPVGAPEFWDFQINWHYEFESVLALNGEPNVWNE